MGRGMPEEPRPGTMPGGEEPEAASQGGGAVE
jgi:hypothetical protein